MGASIQVKLKLKLELELKILFEFESHFELIFKLKLESLIWAPNLINCSHKSRTLVEKCEREAHRKY